MSNVYIINQQMAEQQCEIDLENLDVTLTLQQNRIFFWRRRVVNHILGWFWYPSPLPRFFSLGWF